MESPFPVNFAERNHKAQGAKWDGAVEEGMCSF